MSEGPHFAYCVWITTPLGRTIDVNELLPPLPVMEPATGQPDRAGDDPACRVIQYLPLAAIDGTMIFLACLCEARPDRAQLDVTLQRRRTQLATAFKRLMMQDRSALIEQVARSNTDQKLLLMNAAISAAASFAQAGQTDSILNGYRFHVERVQCDLQHDGVQFTRSDGPMGSVIGSA